MDRARRRTSTLERELDHLRDRRRAAEAAAVRALDRAHDLGIKNDPWYKRAWGAVDRWVDDHAGLLRGISTGLKWVSAAAGLLSFIPVLAPICMPIALATAGASLALDGLLAATGHGSWTSFAVDAVLMGLPGVGRLVSRAVRPGARAGAGADDIAHGADDALDAGRSADSARHAVGPNAAGRGVDRAAEAGEAARARRIEELAADPAHGGRVRAASRAEAEVGQALEDSGAVKGLRRDPSPAAEFIDESGQAWDVKAFHSDVPPGAKGGFQLEKAMESITAELRAGENVMVDTRHMTSDHVRQLREAVRAAGEEGRVLFWP